MMDDYIPISLSNLFRLGLFQILYAKSDSNPGSTQCSPRKAIACSGKGGAGDAPSISKCTCNTPKCSKSTVSDRGKTGACVTGSRSEDRERSDEKGPVNLPGGAANPGLLRHIHNAARYRLPQCFEGACVSVKQSSASNWVFGHTLSFSSVSPGGYKVLLSYVDKERPASLPYFVMEAAPGGQMSCEFRVGPTQATRATVVAQIANGVLNSCESIIDAYFNSFTASVIAVNREFIAIHCLQSITERFSLGAEVVARGRAPELIAASAAARWAGEEQSVSATLGSRGLDLCYARALRPHLTAAAMLEVGFAIRKAVATLAYEWRADDWTVRASVDSDGLVGATLQRALGGKRAKLACAISALLNHPNDKFRLGFGVTAAIL